MRIRFSHISIISFLLISFRLHSQTYYKIPIDTNHYWRQFSICLNGNSVNRKDYQIRYHKDTLINGKVYNKYNTFGREYGFCCCPSFISNGFLRQDSINKKVFILDNSFIERPLYDFSKTVGDTLLHYNNVLNSNVTLTVQALDTAFLFDGTQHKAIWVSNNNCFIEGVGSLFGGLYGHDQLISTPNNISEQLMCFGKVEPFFNLMDGLTQTIYNCGLVPQTVNINEYEKNVLKITIYPNPVKDKLKLLFEDKIIKVNATVKNVFGQTIKEKELLNGENEIDFSDLPSGIYFLKLQNNSEQKAFKIIKE